MYLTFNYPEYLWYLLSIPLLIISHFAFLKYTKRKAMRFANFQALKRVSEERVITRNYIILFIRIFIILFLIAAISGTKLWYQGLASQNDYIITLDTSSSMTAKDFQPTRLDAAKKYSFDFLNNLKADASVGVVSFSGAAFIEQLPTKDISYVRQSLERIEIAHVGGTNIPDAIVTSTNLLIPSKNGKIIILITDGSNTAGYFTKDPIKESIKYARFNNVVINTIGVGTSSGPIGYLPEYYNITSVSDESVLFTLANGTGGQYYAAANDQDMKTAFQDIVSGAKKSFIGVDLGSGVLLVALAFVFLEWFLINTRFKSVP